MLVSVLHHLGLNRTTHSELCLYVFFLAFAFAKYIGRNNPDQIITFLIIMLVVIIPIIVSIYVVAMTIMTTILCNTYAGTIFMFFKIFKPQLRFSSTHPSFTWQQPSSVHTGGSLSLSCGHSSSDTGGHVTWWQAERKQEGATLQTRSVNVSIPKNLNF